MNWSCKEDYFTNIFGITISTVGTIALVESQLQTQLIGQQLPLTKGTILALFTISFGLTMTTQGATKALQKITSKI
jgi:hypothetical protein